MPYEEVYFQKMEDEKSEKLKSKNRINPCLNYWNCHFDYSQVLPCLQV